MTAAKKKGFKKQAKLYHLTFEDPDLEGFECITKSISTGDFLEITGLAQAVQANPGESDILLRKFATALVSWNLEDEDDTPVPAVYAQCRDTKQEVHQRGGTCVKHTPTEEGQVAVPCPTTGIIDQELGFILQIVVAWQAAIGSVATPLLAASNGGGTSDQEPSMLSLANSSKSL